MRQAGATDKAASRTTLVLAHSHELLLEALTGLLEAAGLRVVARCASVAELERCLRLNAPQIALVDAELVGAADAGELIATARRALPGGRLVILAPALDCALARAALSLEVDGVLLKSSPSSDAIDGLRRIAAGDSVFPAGWLHAARHPPANVEAEALSDRQREVLELLALGLPNDLIAERLFISRNTVKFHVAAIYQRLGVRNRVQAARALGGLRLSA